mgnify:CR=1 FL=1
MGLRDKNYQENDRKLNILLGGNGDYVIQIWDKDEKGMNVVANFEVCTSGGAAPSSVKVATAELYRALEEHGLNEMGGE